MVPFVSFVKSIQLQKDEISFSGSYLKGINKATENKQPKKSKGNQSRKDSKKEN